MRTLQAFLTMTAYLPLMTYAIAFLLLSGLLFVLGRVGSRNILNEKKVSSLPITIGSILVIVNFIILSVICLITPGFMDHIESAITIDSMMMLTGHPLFQAPETTQQYSMIYGPMLSLIQSCFMYVFTPSFFSAKLPGFILSIVNVYLIYHLSFVVFKNRRLSLFMTAIFVALITRYSFLFWGVRADTMVLFCVILSSILILRAERRVFVLLIIGILAGVAINLKTYAFIYFIPQYYFLLKRSGLKAFIPVLPAILGSAYLPFLFPLIDLHSYIQRMGAFSGNLSHPVDLMPIFLVNVSAILFFLIPLFLILNVKRLVREEGFSMLILGISIMAMAFFACHASQRLTYYLVPFIPICFIVFSGHFISNEPYILVNKRMRWWIPYLAILLLFVLIGDLKVGNYRLRNDRLIIKDLDQILKTHDTTPISMGYSSTFPSFKQNDYLTYYQNYLLFKGQPLLISGTRMLDNSILFSYYKTPIIPANTLAAIKSGFIKVWLFPRGATPGFFGSASFKTEFMRHYKLLSNSRFYSLWVYEED